MSQLFYKEAKVYYRLDNIQDRRFVVSVDQGDKRFFLNFASADSFERWYWKLSPNERTINEVVYSDNRKLIIDIDDGDSLDMFDFERHVESRIRNVFHELDIGTPKVVMYNMTDESGNICENKLSYHAVVHNFSFTAATCKGLCIMISAGQVWDKCVDTGIYRTVQCIRMESSTKFGQRRWKQACNDSSEFTQGIVSYLEDTVESDFVCDLHTTRVPHKLMDFDVDMSQFKVGRSNGNYVPLYRTKPGYCSQCNRVHDRENASIRYVMGQPTFVCWRYAS